MKIVIRNVSILLLVCVWSAAAKDMTPRVELKSGPIEGVRSDDGHLVFYGIPYASPPVKEHRWQPPLPVTSWSAVRPAKTVAPACWQAISTGGFYSRGELTRSEDCLYLNVWTPARDASADLAVMVWIHGGAFTTGHGGQDSYSGSQLIKENVVVVSINYRLGNLGFLAHPALSRASKRGVSGNYGILDQIAALEWVNANIAAFGGDPNNITIFGESAGAASVCYLVATPLAKNLFQKAVAQSGGCFAPHRNLKVAGTTPPTKQSGHVHGAAFTDHFGIQGRKAEVLEKLHALSPEEILKAPTMPYPPIVVDGWVFPEQMYGLFKRKKHNPVDIIVGSNADEGTTLFRNVKVEDRAALQKQLAPRLGKLTEKLLHAYRTDINISTSRAMQQMMADPLFAWQARSWGRLITAGGGQAYVYLFNRAPYLNEKIERQMGAFHGADIQYVMGHAREQWDSTDTEVSRLMLHYWVNFAKSADPNGSSLPHWPSYDSASDLTLEIADEPKIIKHLRKEKLDLLDQLHGTFASD